MEGGPSLDRVIAAKLRIPRSNALARDRLDDLLSDLWSKRLCLLVAPAGSGKTTLLARLANTTASPVAWYRAESLDGSLDRFLSHLEASLAAALGDLPRGWTSIEELVAALETWRGDRALLIVDDLHALEGTPAAGAFARLMDYLPGWLVVAAASRSQPAFDLSRLRVADGLLEVGWDDLRFRSWEVERLFRDYYREPLLPVELALLARKTEGWAAGLQLFHLATRGKTPEERRRMLSALDGRSRFLHEYLAGNVLSQLPADQRRFLVQTCVLGRLSGPICDRFTGESNSEALLRELERRQVFVQPLEDEGDYRYHEVLRSHLEVVLLQAVGEVGARDLHRRSAAVLEEFGALPEALHSYCRAEDWGAVDRILGLNGERLVQGSARWIDSLPPPVLDHDPWLLLASARRHRAEGRWEAAVSAFQRAEQSFGAAEAGAVCRRERQATASWLNLNPAPPGEPLGALRLIIQRDPMKYSSAWPQMGVAAELLMTGAAFLVAGNMREAERSFSASLAAGGAGGGVEIGARLGLGLARLMTGDPAGAGELARAGEAAEQLGHGCLGRLARMGSALRPGNATGAEEAVSVRLTCERLEDAWGAGFASLVEGLALLKGDASVLEASISAFRRAGRWFHRMGAEALEAWSLALLALAGARAGSPWAKETALEAERLANSRGADGAKVFAYLALARVDPARSRQYIAHSEALQEATGLTPPPLAAGAEGGRAPMTLRLFGGFQMTVDGQTVDLQDLKPRARTLLRLLAAHAGRPVHRHVIQAALWPEADADSGGRNLHVAMSSLRSVLERSGRADRSPILVRDGDAYRLVPGPESSFDLLAFEHHVSVGRRALATADSRKAAASFRAALGCYQGELLPEDGPAEWVLEHRERARSWAVETAQALAEILLGEGEAEEAARACVEGLRADRFHDPLWRLLILARERAGDRMAASRARTDYEGMLAELGLPAEPV
jgi:DNA-binding SARP family transcriptional activator